MPSDVARLVDSGRLEVVTLSEDELRSAWHRLAKEEGAFCEPASAAGPRRARAAGTRGGETAVCILTGHGLKDTDAVEALRDGTPVERGARRGARGDRMSVHALAPASTANLGPAFDCAAAALELWNEVVVEESDERYVTIEGEGATSSRATRIT